MSLFIPTGSNYDIATRAMKRHQRRQAIFEYVGVLILIFIAVGTFLGLTYWLWEIGASLIIDAFVYVILPMFALGLMVAFFQNWTAVWCAVGKAFTDMLDMLLMR